jgi:formylglycine-generating enzyme required for sulfatase activity
MPVLCVTWDGTQAYAGWVGGQLPTEAEWEKAARGTEGRINPWRNSQPDHYKANYRSGVVGELSPVGTRLDGASPYGALDMAGNAAEWLADWYDEDHYGRSVYRNPKGPDSGEYRVSRGGNMSSPPRFVRSAYRARSVPNGEHTSNGLRVVVTPDPSDP